MPWTVNPDHGYLERFTVSGGGGSATNINVDVAQAPGVDPVVPNGSDNITFTGAQVASGVVGANVLRTFTNMPSEVIYQIQQSGASAAQDTTLNGVAHFDSANFTVTNGFVSLLGGSAGISSLITDVAGPVMQDGSGQVTFTGEAVAAHAIPIESDGSVANTLSYQVQVASAQAASSLTNAGLASFDSGDFAVDANGFVSLAGSGGLFVQSINVDANTAPGTDPVVPNVSGVITVTGGQIASGTIGANVIRTISLAANTYTVQIQRSNVAAASDSTLNGVAHFDSANFNIDANGFVTLDATVPINFTADVGSAVPALNNINILGGEGIDTSGAGSTITISGEDASNVNKGIASFQTGDFTVVAGHVSLATQPGELITGDSGGALSPTANNWNILGRSGSKTSGSGSTLTIKSPPYSNQGSSTTVTLNSGSFATNTITLTTPATAGLADGDLLEFVATDGILTIQLAATQVAQLGNTVTSTAGTITGTATGDVLGLRYQASTNKWWATSWVGIWILA
ncbi:hypothetical protein UFOVP844_2 [uncultured Caudovirales phage]|uniref:Uncharacterized protein n=1 Tax=uncultured Caudovirales phage TaxID=2100421 RepID=A0A6J5P3T0_9CAUD|nr:hypothetical protein UFOVP844_2 [uncultured Caudovirales phage]